MLRVLVSYLFLIYGSMTAISQDVIFEVDFNEISNHTIEELISSTPLAIENQFNRPETILSPFESALRFDGHSTYIEETGFDFANSVTDKMAIEVWYSTESFNQSSVGLLVQQDVNAGFSLKVRPYGKVLYQFFADNTSYFVQSDESIPVYEWNHIIAQVDLQTQLAEIYLNGQKIAEKEIDMHSDISLTSGSVPLFIGRDRIMSQAFGFITTTANGALDEARIYNKTLSAEEIQTRYEQATFYETDLYIDPNIRHPEDHLRPRYHFMPNTSWANEAYGLTYYNNQYHLFFQKNPNAPILNFMHWGHMSSPDLVQWREEQMPLHPEDDFSSVGKWSGTTFFNKEGSPVIAYTGVNGQFAGIGIAESTDPDLIEWQDIEENPVLDRAPSSIPNQDFRDPYIWCEGDTYYMVVGSGKANNQGGILMSYKSTDYTNWELIDPVFETTANVGGRFWEMPYFNKINEDDYLFVVTPQFIGLPAKTIYWVGSFVDEQFTPYFDTPKDFELLQKHLLSPAIGLDENGDHTYIGIIPEDRNVEDQIKAGWRQTFSLPRVLRLLDDGHTIGHYPHPNLCRARKNEYAEEAVIVDFETENNLPNFRGNQAELHFKIYNPDVDKFEIRVFQSENKLLYTAITFNKSSGKLGINRIKSSPFSTTEDNQFRDYTFNSNDSIDVRIFLDHSILEVFVDNLVVMSARVYPGQGSDLIDIVATTDGSLEIDLVESWDIDNKEEEKEDIVCPPTLLPDGLFTTSVFEEQHPTGIEVYPNPSNNNIRVSSEDSWSHIVLRDSSGRRQLVNFDGQEIDISQLSSGIYFGSLQSGSKSAYFKFIKL